MGTVSANGAVVNLLIDLLLQPMADPVLDQPGVSAYQMREMRTGSPLD